MANIPEDGVTLKDDEAADEADPDKRNPTALKDKQIEPDNEFEDAPGKSGNRNDSSGKEDMDTSVKKEAPKDQDEAMDVDEAKPEAGDAAKASPTKEGSAAVAASS